MAEADRAVAHPGQGEAKKPVTFWRRYRASVFQSYLVFAVLVFLAMAVLAKTVAYFTFDVMITQTLQSYHGVWFNTLMVDLTWLGFAPQAWVVSVAVVVFLYAGGLKWETVVTAASLIGSEIVGLGVKALVDRPRPSPDLVNVVNQLKDYSFPSGHVLWYSTFFGFLVFLAYTLLKYSWWRSLIIVVLLGMIALIGPSRIYEGQHWASDVIAAYLLGSVWLSLSILIYRWGKTRYFVNQPAAPPDVPAPPGN